MANPTSQVPSRELPYGGDDKFYIGYPTGQTDAFYNCEMIGQVPATGFGAHFDDTQALNFWGVFSEPTRQISPDLPAPILLMCKRPRLFTMPLAAGQQSRGYQIGGPVYAADSGHVTLNPLTLSYANVVGFFVDIAGASPETTSGATSIWIDPMPLIPRGSGMMGAMTGPDAAKVWGVEVLNRTVFSAITAGRQYTLTPIAQTVAGDSIEFINSTASVLTLKGNGSETINNVNTYALAAAAYSAASVTSDGTQWWVNKKI